MHHFYFYENCFHITYWFTFFDNNVYSVHWLEHNSSYEEKIKARKNTVVNLVVLYKDFRKHKNRQVNKLINKNTNN